MALADFLKRDCKARACHPAELGDASSVWKGRSHQFCSSHPHTRTPQSPGLPAPGIYYPGRRGLALGSHSKAATPAPSLQPAETLGVSGCLPPPVHPAVLLQSQHRAWNAVSPKDGAGPSISKPRGAGTLPPLDLFSWILHPSKGGVEPNEVSDHSSAGTEFLQNRQTHSRCSRHCLLGAKPLDRQNLTSPVWHMVF